MARQDLIAAIRNALERGESVEDAKKSLVNAGYSITEVEEAESQVGKLKQKPNMPKPRQNKLPLLPKTPEINETPIPTKENNQNKKSTNIILILAIVLFVIIVVVLILFFIPNFLKGNVSSTDCVNDIDCFISASQDCKTAKMTTTDSAEMFGIINTFTVLWNMNKESQKCVISWKYEDITLKYSNNLIQSLLSSGLTQAEINQHEQKANNDISFIKSKTITCKFNNANDLTNMLTKWLKEKEFSATFSFTISPENENETNYIFPQELQNIAECSAI